MNKNNMQIMVNLRSDADRLSADVVAHILHTEDTSIWQTDCRVENNIEKT